MPVSLTYPGVYIEEIPSGVRTITGVPTAVTAFVGFTSRGKVNDPVHIFSFADFEREFGGLSTDSPLSYAVRYFFLNGGGEGYVVRVAAGATAASVTLRSATDPVLRVTVASEGAWGNGIRLDVENGRDEAASLFSLRVTELIEQNGETVPGRFEEFHKLSMSKFDPNFVVNTINARSELIRLETVPAPPAGLQFATAASVKGTAPALGGLAQADKLTFVVNGGGPFTMTVTPSNDLAIIGNEIRDAINGAVGGTPVTVAVVSGALTFTVTTPATADAALNERASLHFLPSASGDARTALGLDIRDGATETEAQALQRPLQTGTVGNALTTALGLPNTAAGRIKANVRTAATAIKTIVLTLWGGATGLVQPTTPADALDRLAKALGNSSDAYLKGVTVSLVNGRLRILPPPFEPNRNILFENFDGTDTTAADLKLVVTPNVARYAPGVGLTFAGQIQGLSGLNGTEATADVLRGKELAKSGMYALEKADIFNLLVMVDPSAKDVFEEAIAYCIRRRAFMIIDAPDDLHDLADAQRWIEGDAASLRSRNSALYFPRIRSLDPLSNTVKTFAAAGALAGLYARTDAERGVWKAPAGTQSTVLGAQGLSVSLTDKENGALNPKGLNCLRTFKIIGTVAWGARTGKGADDLADEYKYIPVRRLALYLEESLYRGSQWAVFEPNDEPLWAQIRLNFGAFMHNLFAQGAFQGQTAREAYFVKCDKETTTQNDVDLGRVNIIVGFAPLKPAEFVVIKIQQIAGKIQT